MMFEAFKKYIKTTKGKTSDVKPNDLTWKKKDMFLCQLTWEKWLYFVTCHSLFPHAALICDLVLFPPSSFPVGIPGMLRFIVWSCRGSLKGRVSAQHSAVSCPWSAFLWVLNFRGIGLVFFTLHYCIELKLTVQSTQSGLELDKVTWN